MYFTCGPGKVIARLKDDQSGFAETPRPVELSDAEYNPATRRDPGNLFGFEGVTMFKAKCRYYFGSTDKYHGRCSMCMAIPDNIYSPYRRGTKPCPATAAPISSGRKTASGTAASPVTTRRPPWRGKPGIVRIDFDAGGWISVAKTRPDFVLLR